MAHRHELLIGTVAYDPRVVTIWEGFRAWFAERDLATDVLLYSNYERQVEDLMDGRIDVGWNSPLAWVRSRRIAAARGVAVEALAMRDTDRDLTSVILVRAESEVEGPEDLAGRTVAVGAVDSPQATLLPLLHLRSLGLEPGADVKVLHHDTHGGKHGDHGAAERDAARSLLEGRADAACALGGHHILFASEGVAPPGSLRVLGETPRFDHCNFTVGPGAPAGPVVRLRDLLFEMSYDDPRVRHLMELEGLRRWVDGRTDGYGDLERAVDAFGFYDAGGRVTASGYAY
jgi:phosphonate transport system substrate-binding protein